jgi:hypothetical protein
MAVAELLLRLGCSLTGWLVLFTHALWLAVLGVTGCTSDGAEPWLALLWLTPLTILFAALLPLGLAVPGVARPLRLPGLALLPLLLMAMRTPWQTLFTVNVDGGSLCGSTAAWTAVWSPVQLTVAVLLAAAVAMLWLRAGRTRLSPPGGDDIQRRRLGEE